MNVALIYPNWSVNGCSVSTKPSLLMNVRKTIFRPPVMWSAPHLLEGFEEQNVSAGVLQAATLLVRFGMHHSRLGVVVVVVVGIVRLRAHWAARQTTVAHFSQAAVAVSSAFSCGYWPETLRLYLPVVDSAKAVGAQIRGRLIGCVQILHSTTEIIHFHTRRLIICSWQVYNSIRIRITYFNYSKFVFSLSIFL